MAKARNLYYVALPFLLVAQSCVQKTGMENRQTTEKDMDTAVDRTKIAARPDWLKEAYWHVVRIEKSNIIDNGKRIVLDFTLPELAGDDYAFFLSDAIPPERFFGTISFYPELEQFVLVVPDWKYYNRIAEDAKKSGIAVEPMVVNSYYRVRRWNGQIHVDSVYIEGEGHPEFKFFN